MPQTTSHQTYTRPTNDDPDRNANQDHNDRLDSLHSAHNDIESDSDDAEYRNDKQALLFDRPNRSNTNASEARAYSRHKRTISSPRIKIGRLPAWMCGKRMWTVLILLALFLLLMTLQSGGYWTYKPSTINGESPPWHPSSLGGTTKRWEASYKKASELVDRMSLTEKVNVTTGTGWMMGLCVGNTGAATAVGFPSLCLQDGPLGIRFADNITAGPAALTVGATWNQDLMYKRGRTLGIESKLKGINVLLGPSVGPLGRVPAGGRNWEGFGIDPVLQGVAAALTVRGIQEEGVMATIKHFVGNEQEHYRQANEWGLPEAISSNMDDRTLHEIYAWPFADSIRHGVSSVMCSYNQVNNSYACQNSKLLNGILKDEMGFQGFVQSDWLAQRSGIASAISGLDMSMPGDGEKWADGRPYWGEYLTMAALNGSLPMQRLNDMATRIVASWYQLKQDEWSLQPPNGTFKGPNFSSWTNDKVGLLRPGSDDPTTGVVNRHVDVTREGAFSHSALARRIAAEGTVLVKNTENMLPLSRHGWSQQDEVDYEIDIDNTDMAVAVYGEDAILAEGGPNVCPDRGCNKGTLAQGWGSGAVEFPYLVSPWQALKRDFRSKTVDLRLWPTNDPPTGEIGTLPEDQDLCIVFVNAAGGEGFISSDGIQGDRNDLYLQKGGEQLVQDVSSRCGQSPEAKERTVSSRGNTIVVIHSIGPVVVESFIEKPEIGAVLFAHLPGQESGNALADVLFGRVNPSGHLPYTIPKHVKDFGPSADLIYTDPGPVPQQNFTEGLLVDYRWFDAMKLTPRFEFGFGLSYTKYNLEELQVITKYDDRPSPLPEPRPEDEREAPTYAKEPPSPETAVFPTGLQRLKKYIYPYINSAQDVVPETDPEYKHYETQPPSQAGGGEGGNPSLWEELVQIEVDVVNEGDRSGQAVVQLYVVFPQDTFEEHEVMSSEASSPQSQNDAFEPGKQAEPGKAEKAGDDSKSDDEEQKPDEDRNQADDARTSHENAHPVQDKKPDDPARRAIPIQRRETRSERITFPPRVLRAFDKIHLRGSLSGSTPGSKWPSKSTFLKKQDHQQPDTDTPKYRKRDEVKDKDAANDNAPPSEDKPAPDPASAPAARSATSDPPLQSQSQSQSKSQQHAQIPMPAKVAPQYTRVHQKVAQPPTQYATGEKQTVVFYLTRRDLSYWSVRQQNWVLPKGSFGIEVGFSSRDVRVRSRVF